MPVCSNCSNFSDVVLKKEKVVAGFVKTKSEIKVKDVMMRLDLNDTITVSSFF